VPQGVDLAPLRLDGTGPNARRTTVSGAARQAFAEADALRARLPPGRHLVLAGTEANPTDFPGVSLPWPTARRQVTVLAPATGRSATFYITSTFWKLTPRSPVDVFGAANDLPSAPAAYWAREGGDGVPEDTSGSSGRWW
jgi:hypothetical protein